MISISGPLYVLELLELLLLNAVNPDAETRRGTFGDEPDLSLPAEKEVHCAQESHLASQLP